MARQRALPRSPKQPPGPKSMLSNYQKKILYLTNAIRRKHNLSPVTLHSTLNHIAMLHNTDIAYRLHQLSHISSDGKRLSQRLRALGHKFSYASENIAKGQRTCQWVMTSWMKSPGHRKNILNHRCKDMGVHVGVRNNVIWWTVIFAS